MRLRPVLPLLLSLLVLFPLECSAQNVLMFGNSYTMYSNLSGLLRNLLQTQDPTISVNSQLSGGKTIGWHADNVADASSNHATKLANLVAGDVLFLQDQSQVPSCTCFGSYDGSFVGAKSIRIAMPANTDMIMYMTWGRKNSDNNDGFNNCYSEMQDRLRQGYEEYRDNALTSGAGNVYIAPVGYAFKKIHDEELCSPDPSPATCQGSGNTGLTTGCNAVGGSYFESLYSGDGSHPSLRGSYLTACVMFATMTGMSPVGLPGPDSMDAVDIVKLQDVAKSVVLDDSENLGYSYSWTGTTIKPATQTSAPVQPTASPVVPTLAPVQPTLAPVQPTLAPVQPTLAPVQPTLAPVQPTLAPVQPTLAPIQPTLAPIQPTLAPVESPSENPSLGPSGSNYPSNAPSITPSEGPSGFSEPSVSPSAEEPATPTAAPTVGFVACFSGISMVTTETKGLIPMSELELGDRVLIATEGSRSNDESGILRVNNRRDVFDTVYAFGHLHPTLEASFLQIQTASSTLEITPDHMVLIHFDNSRYHVPASQVKVGTTLVLSSGELDIVQSIRTVQRSGVYAPFTYSGTLIVNNCRVSSYVAFQGSDVLIVGGYRTFLRYHWLAYVFETPHRITSQLGMSSESYSEEGISTWVATPLKIANWLLG